MKQFIKDNKVRLQQDIIVVDGNKQIINPSLEQVLADGWQEYVHVSVEPCVLTYEERVEQLIREKYSVNQEFAVQRQRETKPEEFTEYFAYCEECKQRARTY